MCWHVDNVILLISSLLIVIKLCAGHNDVLMARWNSNKGSIFVDGSHMEVCKSQHGLLLLLLLLLFLLFISFAFFFHFQHKLELGDEIFVTAHAPHLNLFECLPK